MNRDKIIKFTSNRVWRTYTGGKLLDQIEGNEDPDDSNFPEDWIGSTVEARNPGRDKPGEGLAMVEGADGKPIPFRELLLSDPKYNLGTDGDGVQELENIPLVKYLDSSTRLHFQAHPTSEFSQARLGSPRGKTEAYVILDSRAEVPEPYIYAGFQRSPNREELKGWIESQDIDSMEKCFDKIPVKPGDVFLIPGGRPHALGEGILMLEIMEPSDLAVRFEFEREGLVIPEEARFMGRDIETALDVFNLDPVEPESIDEEFRCQPTQLLKTDDGSILEELIGQAQTKCFGVKRMSVVRSALREENEFFYGVVVEGAGEFIVDGNSTELKKWDRFFCPAGVSSFEYKSTFGMTILECFPGKY
ncbi:hypothetical protein MLD52_21280 [Puniceicoccaceae bacterium K14]|nr:hypothetical protein [Puniceicoccaceae bacterium K14]